MAAGRSPRFVFVVSTAGSVMNETLKNDFLRSVVHSVVADRPCDAIDKAKAHSVATELFDEGSNESFCDRLAHYLNRHEIDFVISVYTGFYTDAFRAAFEDRVINFHPSLLPAFKGMDGFGDGVVYHVKILGTTVELIRDRMDEGKIVMQTATAVDPTRPLAELRHRIFVQQCKTLLQVVKWLHDGRIRVSGMNVTVDRARYRDIEFSPALDFDDARELEIPGPGTPQAAQSAGPSGSGSSRSPTASG